VTEEENFPESEYTCELLHPLAEKLVRMAMFHEEDLLPPTAFESQLMACISSEMTTVAKEMFINEYCREVWAERIECNPEDLVLTDDQVSFGMSVVNIVCNLMARLTVHQAGYTINELEKWAEESMPDEEE